MALSESRFFRDESKGQIKSKSILHRLSMPAWLYILRLMKVPIFVLTRINPLTPVSGTGQALPSPPGLGERVGVRGFMRVKTKMSCMGTLLGF